MKNPMIIFFMISVLGTFHSSFCNGQEQKDSLKTFKNAIRMNVSNPMLFGDKNLIFGYERILKKNQSVTVNLGRFSLPEFSDLGNDDSLQLQKDTRDKGFSIAMDYRFYLGKFNRYDAPRGVYIGPYYSYNYFERENSWVLNGETNQDLWKTDIKAQFNLVGVQLGYQFVFWKRLSVDLILFGPGIWFYNVNAEVNTNLTSDEEQLLFDKINRIIDEKIPANNVVINSEFHQKGSSSSATGGLRYVMHIGFRF